MGPVPASGDVDGVEVVVHAFAQCPRQVVVAVQHGVCGQHGRNDHPRAGLSRDGMTHTLVRVGPMTDLARRRVALVTLGCTRNEVDSEELAGRLTAGGWELVEDAADADVAVVNTCGFIEQAKKDSIDTLLEASELKASGPHPGGCRRRLPRRALRPRARRGTARSRRGARIRFVCRSLRTAARHPRRGPARESRAERPSPAPAAH
jgi:hypothetical protein